MVKQMEASVAVVDYDCGNLRSLERALIVAGAVDVHFVRTADEIEKASRLILPGVGAFGQAADALAQRGLSGAICRFAETGRPLLGICLGMQLLFDESDEFGVHRGLGLIPGRVEAFDQAKADAAGWKIPHIGWAAIERATIAWDGTVLEGLTAGEHLYFVHSYSGRPKEKAHVLAVADFAGEAFCAVAQRGNVTGCQFHPEKSAEAGLGILRRFLNTNMIEKG